MPDGALFDEMGIMVTDDGRLVVHGHTTYALRLVSSVRLEKDPAQPVWLLALVAVLGFGSGHPTFGALMAVLFVVALLRVGRGPSLLGCRLSTPHTSGGPSWQRSRHSTARRIPASIAPVATVPRGTTLRGRMESRGGATCATTAGDFIHKLAVSDR